MKKRVPLSLTLIFLLIGAVAAQKSFYNKEFNFGFKYPPGSTLQTDADSVFAYPPLKGMGRVTVRKTGATAMIAAAAMTRDACRTLSTADDTPRKQKFGSVAFNKTTGVDGGMESVHPYEYYRTFHKGVCYEVRITVGMEKYPKRRVSPTPLLEQLYPILRTFYFR